MPTFSGSIILLNSSTISQRLSSGMAETSEGLLVVACKYRSFYIITIPKITHKILTSVPSAVNALNLASRSYDEFSIYTYRKCWFNIIRVSIMLGTNLGHKMNTVLHTFFILTLPIMVAVTEMREGNFKNGGFQHTAFVLATVEPGHFGTSHFLFRWEVVLFNELTAKMSYHAIRKVSFVGRLLLSQRVLHWRFHCTWGHFM